VTHIQTDRVIVSSGPTKATHAWARAIWLPVEIWAPSNKTLTTRSAV